MNGIKLFRQQAGITKSELARRVGTNRQQLGRLEDGQRTLSIEWATRIANALGNCTARDLMFPEQAKFDTARFKNVFEVSMDSSLEHQDTPTLALDMDFLARMLPSAAKHRLQVMMVDSSNPTSSIVAKGDAVVIDLDDNRPSRPGLYAVNIANAVQWRYLSPTTAGLIQVHSENPAIPAETVGIDDLKVVGRAKLKISTL